MDTTINGLQVHYTIFNEQYDKTIVALHGFTGSVNTWSAFAKEVKMRVVAVDLVGHGLTDAPEAVAHYTVASQISMLEQLFEQLHLSSFTLLGYSLGGRVALSYVCAFPQRVERLLLESASPGLQSEEERLTRQHADESLAQMIENQGVQAFVDYWQDIPLFASQKQLSPSAQSSIRAERMAQRKIGLANSLRGMGTGVMPPLWDQLSSLNIRITLVTGSKDTKFVNIANAMQSHLKYAKHYTVEGAGHAIHVENLAKFVTIVEEVFQEN